MNFHKLSLFALYGLTIYVFGYAVIVGGPYYLLPETERPHHPLHEDWKPSGVMSHGFGISGSAMMLILLLYSVRKRARFMSDAGNIRYWLNYHIWLGVTGPLLVLLHTSFKFGGIVSVSFWSMVAVVASGVIGRYIYVQIPRSLSGQEFSRAELEDQDRALLDELSGTRGVDANVLVLLREATATQSGTAAQGIGALWKWLVSDILLFFRLRRIRSRVREITRLRAAEIRRVIALTRKRAKLERKLMFLATAHKLLHHWHIFHKPFAVIMLVIMFVHIVVTVALGYRWIFP